MTTARAATVVIMLTAGAAIAEVTVSSIITMQDVQAAYDAKQWAECLKKISTMMPQASPQDKITLLSLKAECLLGQKSGSLAADNFAALATMHMSKTAKDVKAAATAKATSELIRVSQMASGDLVYVPKIGKDRTALSIVDPAARQTAMKAYFTDQQVAAQDGIKALGSNMSMQAVLDFAPKLIELGKVEMAVTGDDKQTMTMQKDLALKMKNGMDAYISNSSKSVDNIARSAATLAPARMSGVQSGGNGVGQRGQRMVVGPQVAKGLTEQDKQKLQEMVTDLQKIQTDAKPLALTLGMEADYYKAEVASVGTLRTRIDALLSGKYK